MKMSCCHAAQHGSRSGSLDTPLSDLGLRRRSRVRLQPQEQNLNDQRKKMKNEAAGEERL
ncbi:hypothetical protein EYF80_028432 [Liparis tanakae]|uniref:Uncharacterized protein n=1 Tax=Liparis tanakae TaxID=230148 RepID=A0A4Z2H840_9TELE|nr:hypothetical protein EYF80_028432 [Liparis tanakae]